MVSLFILYNLSRDPTNYPAFFFSNAIDELIPYAHAQSNDLASTAKFILSFLHMHLDCDQLFALKFEEKELEYCVSSLTSAINSTDFQADGISADEFLQVLTGATHPSISVNIIKISPARYIPKKKARSSKAKLIEFSYFDEKMIEVAEELMKNSLTLNKLDIISLIEAILKKEQFQMLACKLLWNLLHHESIRTKVLSSYPGIHESLEVIEASNSADNQLISHCCLWLLGACNKGTYYITLAVACVIRQ